MSTIKGQCYCGKVKFEFDPPIKFMAHDHCSICRKVSGSPFTTWVGTFDDKFRILSGADNLSAFKTTPEATREFCKTCGSHLFFKSSRWPGEVHVTAGSLTTEMSDAPQAHVFFSDRVKWIEVNDGLPKYGGKTGLEPLNT